MRNFFYNKIKKMLKVLILHSSLLKKIKEKIKFIILNYALKIYDKGKVSVPNDLINNKIYFYNDENLSTTFLNFCLNMFINKDYNKDYKLVFNINESPKVSIIIANYNNSLITLQCLYFLFKNTYNYSYEIIIIDDASTNIEIEIEKYVSNVKFINNEINLGFLKSCNKASCYANGEYIVILNNDTCVLNDWLTPLIKLIENDKTIGLIGSKLLFKDGLLQEAGGIIWKDATGWNYGRNQNANKSEYCYVKEVDYISGAAFLIKKSLWDEVGKFDEQFAPAYFEDSDLAFKLRNKGYKIIYHPHSKVVHLDGCSYGNDDINSKKFILMQKNKEIFLKKWKEILKVEHSNNETDVFVARDRTKCKKCILFIDWKVPEFDKDAGSKTTYHVLKTLVKLNFNIKFLPENLLDTKPYVFYLQELGIEVLYGDDYCGENFAKWLENNSKYLHYIYFNRPTITNNYLPIIEKYVPHAIKIYYGHDLHFLREFRKYELEKNPKLLELSNFYKKLERYVTKKMDIVLTCSPIEKEYMQKHFNITNIVVIPPYAFSENNLVSNFDNREDFLFIGGFNHCPNVDGIKWFIEEIFPKILNKHKNIKLKIIGSNMPEWLKELNNNNIILLSGLSDEKLMEEYLKTKISIIPLRYGAGIKGKVVEAICYNVPIVSTSCGMEGIIGLDKIYKSCDDAKMFAEELLLLYENNELCVVKTEQAKKIVSTYFSENNMYNVFSKIFTDNKK